MDLAGKNAIVTGAGVRLGRAMALALADAGANIAVHYNRSEGPAKEVAGLISEAGRQSVLVQGDLSDPVPSSAAIVDAATQQLGAIDILINLSLIHI